MFAKQALYHRVKSHPWSLLKIHEVEFVLSLNFWICGRQWSPTRVMHFKETKMKTSQPSKTSSFPEVINSHWVRGGTVSSISLCVGAMFGLSTHSSNASCLNDNQFIMKSINSAFAWLTGFSDILHVLSLFCSSFIFFLFFPDFFLQCLWSCRWRHRGF